MTTTTSSAIRPSRPSDSERIAELHAASWRSAYRTALSESYLAGDIVADRLAFWKARLLAPANNQFILVAESDRDLVGFACVFTNDCREWGSLLDNIHVRLDKQSSGVGTALLRMVADLCHLFAENAGLFLWVLQDNNAAQHFYLRHGARNAGSDIWNAPGGTHVPRFRFAWSASQVSSLAMGDQA